MRDCKGVEVKPGDKVVVMTGDAKGNVAWVHRLATRPGKTAASALVADCLPNGESLLDNDAWTFSLWALPKDIAVIDRAD